MDHESATPADRQKTKRLRDAEARRGIESAALNQQIQLLERQQAAMTARESLLEFTRFTMPDPESPNDISRSRYEVAKFHREVATALEAVVRGEITQLIFCMPPRHGKSIEHNQLVITPSGWRKHGELKVGDYVFGPDGKPTEVIALSADVDEVVPVTFSNGEVVRCHLNHEWTVYDRAQRPGHQWRTLETRDIAKRVLRNGPAVGRGGRWTLQLPDASAVEFTPKDLSLHPYILGAWLGDGNADRGQIAHDIKDKEVVNEIAALGFAVQRAFVQAGTGVGYALFAKLREELKHAGVLNNKHIPEIYLRSSVEQRLQLLAGLVDTDGHVEAATGRVRFSTCSEALRDGVFDLASTLGFRPYIAKVAPALSSSGIQGRKVVYQVGFQPTMPIPVRIPRKQITKLAERGRIGIVSVGQVEKGGARSIQVAREDGLYLVGKTIIPTHNTELATKRLAAWFSGKFPEQDIAVASYSDTMAHDMGADTRAIMATPQFKQVFPAHKLRRGGNAKDNIQTITGGRMIFVGRGGALTGRGANLLIIDDLFKDHEEARSQTIRDLAWNWFTKVAMTRRMGKKLVVITMTRWHSDDVIGRLTDPENPNWPGKAEASKWKIIRLPALAESNDPLGREEGEPLWPERYDIDFLKSQQRLDPMGFAALYQQSPTVADGVLFRRETLQFWRPGELPENGRYYAASDFALGTGQRHDSTVHILCMTDRQDNLYVVDCYWAKVDSATSVEAMLNLGGRDRKPLVWWAEKGHISRSIGPFLYKRMAETGNYLNIREVSPGSDKTQRAQSIAARVAMGKVFLPKEAVWAEKAVNELLAFPNGTHDDFVDALAYIGLGLRSQVAASAPRTVNKEPMFGTLAWVKHQDTWAAARDAARGSGSF